MAGHDDRRRGGPSALGLGAMAAGLALAAHSPAAAQTVAQPIRIGIIDTDASAVADERKGVSVTVRSFLADGQKPASHRTQSGREHGADVASSFLDQSWRIDPTRRVEVFSAVAFYQKGNERVDDMNNRPMGLNQAAAQRALDWFKENGVRVVVTTFVVPESPQINEFMRKANEMGMVVFSSVNNVQSAYAPFPARHPDAVSVTGNARNLDFATSGSMKDWVMFKADSGIPGKTLTTTPENGSSFAVARAAAFAAHLVDRDPAMARSEVVEDLRGFAGAEQAGTASLAGRQPIVRIRMHLGVENPEDVAIISMGPSKPKVAKVEAKENARASASPSAIAAVASGLAR